MSTTREPCGCKHNGHAWLELCAPHSAEWNEQHARALADYRKREGLANDPDPWS